MSEDDSTSHRRVPFLTFRASRFSSRFISQRLQKPHFFNLEDESLLVWPARGFSCGPWPPRGSGRELGSHGHTEHVLPADGECSDGTGEIKEPAPVRLLHWTLVAEDPRCTGNSSWLAEKPHQAVHYTQDMHAPLHAVTRNIRGHTRHPAFHTVGVCTPIRPPPVSRDPRRCHQ